MYLLKQIFSFLLLVGFLSPTFAAVDDIAIGPCSVFSAADDDGEKKDGKKEDGKKEGEKEPDCE